MNANLQISASFRNDFALASRLADVCARKRLANVSVGLRINGHRMFAATNEALRLRPVEAAQYDLVSTGCLAKPLTATLLAEAIWQHHLEWGTQISEVLPLGSTSKATFSGIAINHLLSHTHGLDASRIERVPRTHHGFINAEALCQQLAFKPLTKPGLLYSYSNAGAWLAGAVLERLFGKNYAQLLYESRFWPANGSLDAACFMHVCPATGEDLTLTTSQWLSILESHLQSEAISPAGENPARCLASLRAAPIPLPGWSPSEQAACIGWKSYGAGWFGHNANAAGFSALVRFNPEEDIAIVLSAPDEAAVFVLAGLFGTSLPEFSNLKLPRLLNSHERERLSLDRYVGSYRQLQMRVEVTTTSRTALSFAVREQESAHDAFTCVLRPAQDDIFIPELRIYPDFAFVQFVRSLDSDALEYLWNGRQLWRRD